MKYAEYKEAQRELGLTKAQKQLLGRCFGQFLLQPHEAYKDCEQRAQKRGEPLSPVAYRHLGKIDGLKLAMQFVLGTLTMTDGLEPDSSKAERDVNEETDSPLAVGSVEDLINTMVGLMAPDGSPRADDNDPIFAKKLQACVRAEVGAIMPADDIRAPIDPTVDRTGWEGVDNKGVLVAHGCANAATGSGETSRPTPPR